MYAWPAAGLPRHVQLATAGLRSVADDDMQPCLALAARSQFMVSSAVPPIRINLTCCPHQTRTKLTAAARTYTAIQRTNLVAAVHDDHASVQLIRQHTRKLTDHCCLAHTRPPQQQHRVPACDSQGNRNTENRFALEEEGRSEERGLSQGLESGVKDHKGMHSHYLLHPSYHHHLTPYTSQSRPPL